MLVDFRISNRVSLIIRAFSGLKLHFTFGNYLRFFFNVMIKCLFNIETIILEFFDNLVNSENVHLNIYLNRLVVS